jgi:hypothetical protein
MFDELVAKFRAALGLTSAEVLALEAGAEVVEPVAGAEVVEPVAGAEVVESEAGAEVAEPEAGAEVVEPEAGAEVTELSAALAKIEQLSVHKPLQVSGDKAEAIGLNVKEMVRLGHIPPALSGKFKQHFCELAAVPTAEGKSNLYDSSKELFSSLGARVDMDPIVAGEIEDAEVPESSSDRVNRLMGR